jgi:alpha-tubulin suppressor-like RCC1 family protein
VFGQLGYGHTNDIGDDETMASEGEIDLGVRVAKVAAGGNHTCVLTEDGGVRCWGDQTNGQLGYANSEDIGDDELPNGGDVEVGDGEVIDVVAGHVHTCVLFAAGNVRCWGRGRRPEENAVGGFGQLGYGNTEDIGDDEVPAEAGDVMVGGPVAQLTAGWVHTCAVLDTGAVRCWGRAEGRQGLGQLGYQAEENIGDDEVPADAGDVDLGVAAQLVRAGDVSTCAVETVGKLHCWGFGGFGQLGYGNMQNIGDDEPPADAGTVQIGEPIADVAIGQFHACALTQTGRVLCFGLANSGQLGYCDEINAGDDEVPEEIGPVPL